MAGCGSVQRDTRIGPESLWRNTFTLKKSGQRGRLYQRNCGSVGQPFSNIFRVRIHHALIRRDKRNREARWSTPPTGNAGKKMQAAFWCAWSANMIRRAQRSFSGEL
jgi:hypothetical protein